MILYYNECGNTCDIPKAFETPNPKVTRLGDNPQFKTVGRKRRQYIHSLKRIIFSTKGKANKSKYNQKGQRMLLVSP